MLEACMRCPAADRCAMDALSELCDILLEEEVRKEKNEFFQAWLDYISEYADS